MAAIDRRFDTIDRQFDTVNAHLAALDRRMQRFEDDMGLFRARHAREMVRDQSSLVALEVGYRKVRTLTIDDLLDMVEAADTEGISDSALRNFRKADLIMEAEEVETGESGYVAVEISFTVNGRDTERVVRNANFLKRFTGRDAVAVVAGFRKDNHIKPDITAGNVFWFPVDVEDLQTD